MPFGAVLLQFTAFISHHATQTTFWERRRLLRYKCFSAGPGRLGSHLRRRLAIISVTPAHTLAVRLPKQLPVCAWLIYILTRFKSTPLSSIIITQIRVNGGRSTLPEPEALTLRVSWRPGLPCETRRGHRPGFHTARKNTQSHPNGLPVAVRALPVRQGQRSTEHGAQRAALGRIIA